MSTVKTKGYAYPRTNPASRINDRKRRAQAIRERCLAEHPHDENGRCTREEAARGE